MKVYSISIIIGAFLLGFAFNQQEKGHSIPLESMTEAEVNFFINYFEENPDLKVDGFDFPVGIPNGEGYYVAQDFRSNNHLGEDWNGRGGGNTDFGDPVYAIADGYIKLAKEFQQGWGNIIRMVHYIEEPPYVIVESLYAHMDEVYVTQGQSVKRGQQIGTIGNVGGLYSAHLHLEMRSNVMMEIGTAYSSNTEGFMDPSDFISRNRPE